MRVVGFARNYYNLSQLLSRTLTKPKPQKDDSGVPNIGIVCLPCIPVFPADNGIMQMNSVRQVCVCVCVFKGIRFIIYLPTVISFEWNCEFHRKCRTDWRTIDLAHANTQQRLMTSRDCVCIFNTLVLCVLPSGFFLSSLFYLRGTKKNGRNLSQQKPPLIDSFIRRFWRRAATPQSR